MANFKDVFEAFLMGKAVKRKAWAEKEFLTVRMTGFYMYVDDFKSDDWEVLEWTP